MKKIDIVIAVLLGIAIVILTIMALRAERNTVSINRVGEGANVEIKQN